jgi:hypothetical protein
LPTPPSRSHEAEFAPLVRLELDPKLECHNRVERPAAAFAQVRDSLGGRAQAPAPANERTAIAPIARIGDRAIGSDDDRPPR